jgi:hypothetical protein
MMNKKPVILIAVIIVGLGAAISVSKPVLSHALRQSAAPVTIGTSFTYQGYLEESGNPANGVYDFEFSLYEIPDTGLGDVIATDLVENIDVADGLFIVQIDFGTVFESGTPYWLEIAVRPGKSTDSYTTLSPRQAIGSSPYALYAASIGDGTVTGSKIGEACETGQVLAFTGIRWECAAADLDITPSQPISQVITIDSNKFDGEVDLSMPGNEIDIIEFQDETGIYHKLPSSMKVKPFDLICQQPCDDLNQWFQNIVDQISDRRAVGINLEEGGETLTWVMSDCFPFEMRTQLSPDGKDLYWRFSIQCDDLISPAPTATISEPVMPYYPPSSLDFPDDNVPPALQQIDTSIIFNDPVHGVVDLRTLHILVELVGISPSPPSPYIRFTPGSAHWGDIDVLCSGDCQALKGWQDDVLDGSYTRQSGEVQIQDDDLQIIEQVWHLYDCFPGSQGTDITDDGSRVYQRFKVSCDSIVPEAYP